MKHFLDITVRNGSSLKEITALNEQHAMITLIDLKELAYNYDNLQ